MRHECLSLPTQSSFGHPVIEGWREYRGFDKGTPIMGIQDVYRPRLYQAFAPMLDKPCISTLRRNWGHALNRTNVTGASPGLSVAITHYRNPEMMHLALRGISTDPRVSEIVILDDGSPAAEVDALVDVLKPYRKPLRLAHRTTNLGPLATKQQVVSLCSQDWVLLLDGDNTVLPNYLNAFCSIASPKPNTIYCAAYAFPQFDFRHDFSGRTLQFSEVCERARTRTTWNGAFFNDGNYFVHRSTFTQVLQPWQLTRVSASDVLFANYAWLSAGNSMHVLKDTSYIHRVHGKSSWKNHRDDSREAARWMMEGLRNDRPLHDLPVHQHFALEKSASEHDVIWLRG